MSDLTGKTREFGIDLVKLPTECLPMNFRKGPCRVADVPEISDDEFDGIEIALKAVFEKWIADGHGPRLSQNNEPG